MSDPADPRNPSLPILDEDPRGRAARVGVAMLRFQNRLERRAAESLAAHGLTLAQFDVLANLAHGEGITQQELAARLLVTKGNVVGIIDRAEAAGWVERRPDPEDRRANRLYLTDAGRQLLARAFPGHSAMMQRVFGTLTAGELALMGEWLARLDRATAEGR